MFLEQRDGRVVEDLCDGQRRLTVLCRPINVRAVVQQQPHRRRGTQRLVNSGVSTFTSARSTSAPLSSNSCAASTWPIWQATYSGVWPLFIAPINVRAFVQQQPRRVDVAKLTGDEQRRPAHHPPDRPQHLLPATTAPRRRVRSGRRGIAASYRTHLPCSTDPCRAEPRSWLPVACRALARLPGSTEELCAFVPSNSWLSARRDAPHARDAKRPCPQTGQCSPPCSESRSAIPGQGGDTKPMALRFALRRKRTKRCPFVGPRRDKAAHP